MERGGLLGEDLLVRCHVLNEQAHAEPRGTVSGGGSLTRAHDGRARTCALPRTLAALMMIWMSFSMDTADT
jgi:hypothetical protein